MITRGAGINQHTSESLGRSSPVRHDADDIESLVSIAGSLHSLQALWIGFFGKKPIFFGFWIRAGYFILMNRIVKLCAARTRTSVAASDPRSDTGRCHRPFQGIVGKRLDTQSEAGFERQGFPQVIHEGRMTSPAVQIVADLLTEGCRYYIQEHRKPTS